MMKALLPAALMLWCTTLATAQENTELNVSYTFSYQRDTGNPDNIYTDSMLLSVGKQTSRYLREKVYNNKMNRPEPEPQGTGNAPVANVTVVAGGPLLLINRFGAIINEEILKKRDSSLMQVYAFMGVKSYVADDVLPVINWKTTEEKKKIGNYACQKATGQLGGRTWEAWFAPELPFQDGPWKLHGLPGLILEASDSQHQIIFAFKALTRPGKEVTTESILNSKYVIRTSLKDYNRAKVAFETDPETVTASQVPNAKLRVKNTDDPEARHAIPIRKFNPMERD